MRMVFAFVRIRIPQLMASAVLTWVGVVGLGVWFVGSFGKGRLRYL